MRMITLLAAFLFTFIPVAGASGSYSGVSFQDDEVSFSVSEINGLLVLSIGEAFEQIWESYDADHSEMTTPLQVPSTGTLVSLDPEAVYYRYEAGEDPEEVSVDEMLGFLGSEVVWVSKVLPDGTYANLFVCSSGMAFPKEYDSSGGPGSGIWVGKCGGVLYSATKPSQAGGTGSSMGSLLYSPIVTVSNPCWFELWPGVHEPPWCG